MADRAQAHRPVGIAHQMHAGSLGHAIDLEHRHLELADVRVGHRHRNGRAATRAPADAGDVGIADRHVEGRGQHCGHTAENLRPIALNQLPDMAHRVRIAPAGRRQHDHGRARGETGQALRQRAADVEQRQAEQDAVARQHQSDQPGLIDLVAVRVAHELGHAGGAAGVEVRGGVAGRDAPPAEQPVRRLRPRQLLVAVDAIGFVARAFEHDDRLESRQLLADALDLDPEFGAGLRAHRDQHLGVGRAQDLGDLRRLQQRIDRVGDARGLRAEQRHEALGQQRQQEAHHVVRADAQRVEHVGGLRHARHELPVAQGQRRFARVGIGQELQGRRLGVARGSQSQRLVGALGGDALVVRRGLESPQQRVGAQVGPLVAHQPVQQMKLRHGASAMQAGA